MGAAWSEWNETEYTAYLHSERRRYAWVMRRHGGLTPAEAEAAARQCYPYEPPDTPYRGLAFHDEPWHWAMLTLHGSAYWTHHPELADPSPEYRTLG